MQFYIRFTHLVLLIATKMVMGIWLALLITLTILNGLELELYGYRQFTRVLWPTGVMMYRIS